MDARKDYVTPAIAAQDTLEQTSLACTATEPIYLNYDFALTNRSTAGNFASGVCAIDITKNGAYYDGITACSWVLDLQAEVVVLS